MFMCKYCLEQYEDKDLTYTLIPEKRAAHPMMDAFLLRFCCEEHLKQFLHQISHQQQRYILVRKAAAGDKQFEPASPLDLLLTAFGTRV